MKLYCILIKNSVLKYSIECYVYVYAGYAGKDWLAGFMRRQNLSNRKAEHTSVARIRGFNKESVDKFFALLKQVYDTHHFPPGRIYNSDETGLSIVPKTSPRIISLKGIKQVGGKTAAERGETVTVQLCMSASGVVLPPMLIFPRVKTNLEMLHDAPPGGWAEFHCTGYMTDELMLKWLKKFVEFTHASLDNPVLLIFDGHTTHVKNLKLIDYANANGVILVCFPPHCTDKMQPLDVGFMSPLSRAFGKQVSIIQRQHVKIDLYNLFSVFGKAFLKVAKMETVVNSFRKCGIYPFNPDVFPESAFVASKRSSDLSSSTSSNTGK